MEEQNEQVPEIEKEAPELGGHNGPRNIIYVGKKPTMSYVLAVVTQFNQGESEVHIKARGQAISKAVDISQIVKNRFLNTAKIGKIDLMTEELTSEDGRLSKVSSMDIQMLKE